MRHFVILALTGALLFTLSGCVTSPTDEAKRDMTDSIVDNMETAIESWAEKWAQDWEDRGEEISERFSDIDAKEHCWKILDADGREISTVTDREKVKVLDDALCRNDIWESPEESPGDPAYTYVYSQEKTLLAGQDPSKERGYEDLLTFTVSASEDVVTMRILGGLEDLSLLPGVELGDILTFSASVPAETAEILRDPAQFTEAE